MSTITYTSKILSILFRVILVLFGLIIVLTKENSLNILWYVFSIIPYLFIYVKTLFKNGIYSKIRLLNDYAFIFLFVWGKELDFLSIIYISLPIINSPNHSGEKKSFLLYVFYILSLFTINNFIWSWSFLTGVVMLCLINQISSLRYQYFNNITDLNNQIDIFLEKDLEINKTYKIYKDLIKALNSMKLLIGFKPNITQIACFRLVNKRVYLENSSEFIWSYSIDENLVTKYHEGINKDNYLGHIPLTIDGKDHNNNFFIFNKSKGQVYLFLFISNEPLNNKIGLIYLKGVLFSTTNRISRVIGIENSIKLENKKMLQDFKNKYFHIQNAEKAMHFIRNRFNTLDNFIEMSKDNISGNMDSEDLNIYKTELERLERNYKMLMERVKSILNKSDKPFSATKLEKKSLNYTFNLVRDTWLDYFSEFNVIINIDFNIREKHEIKINSDGFFILIADWISNIKKYSNQEQQVVFDENNDSFIITFVNNFHFEDKSEIDILMKDFNSTERDKILQRTSHGVLIMKSILEEMNVKGLIEVEEELLKLVLTFKKEENENCYI